MLRNYIKKFYEWEKWEGIMHNILFSLILYILYLFITNKDNRKLSNILLFTIVIALDTLIHQNINSKNNRELFIDRFH